VTKATRKRDKYLKKTCGVILPAEIKVIGKHNHHLHCADTLRLNRNSSELKRTFTSLFDDGHSPSQAKKIHSENLLANDAYMDLADNKTNPTSNSLYYLHKQWSVNNFGKDVVCPLDKIREKLALGIYKEKGFPIISINFFT